jgi:hypothetical protein
LKGLEINVFKEDNPLTAPRARFEVIPWGYIRFYGKGGRINFGGAHWIGNQKF